jgi:hypothetical protein
LPYYRRRRREQVRPLLRECERAGEASREETDDGYDAEKGRVGRTKCICLILTRVTEKEEQEARVKRKSDPALYSCTSLNGSTHAFAGERCNLQAGTLLPLDSAPGLTPFVRHSHLLIRRLTHSCRRGNRDPVLYFFYTRRLSIASKFLSHIQPYSEVIATRNTQKSWSDLSPAWRYVVWRHPSGISLADSHFLATARGCRPLSCASETFRMDNLDKKTLVWESRFGYHFPVTWLTPLNG